MKRYPSLILSTLRALTLQKLGELTMLIFRHPVFAFLSFFATLKAYSLAQKYFPESNSTSGIGNAFRHALWSCLIMMYCCKVSSPEKSADWCLKMTSLHEELFPNRPLEKYMDLHNNKVGLDLFFELLPGIHRQFFETSFFIDALLEKTKTAVVLRNINDEAGNNLIYLKETNPFNF